MNKKLACIAMLSLTITGLTVSLLTQQNPVKKMESLVNGYTLTLNSTNGSFLPDSKNSGQSDNNNSPRTTNENPIIFSYTNMAKASNRFGRMYTNGSLANVTPLSGLHSIIVEYSSGSISLDYGSNNSTYGSSMSVTSGTRYEIRQSSYFRLRSVSSSYITSVTIEYTCLEPSTVVPVQDHTHHGYHFLANEPTTEKPGNKEFYTCTECDYISLEKEDDGVYIDTVLTYELDSNHIAYLPPVSPYLRNDLLRKPTQFDYPIAFNIEVPSTEYYVDNTGSEDASDMFQYALNVIGGSGGGTLYVPAGKYLINKQLIIPSRVTLVGDFKGPNASDYGTVFLCNKPYSKSASDLDNAQIYLYSNAGINGVTFYYPNQNINSVTEYGHTIYVSGNAAANMANLFFINSYKGISINSPTSGSGELANIENVYGTFLYSGISGYSQTDVGYWNNINISSTYYANALSEYRCSNSTALAKYTHDNLTAFTLGDLDDYGFNKINVDNAHIGIYFTDEAVRPNQAFWGFFNEVYLTNCVMGVYAKGIYSNGAAVFTHSSLGQIINVSKYGMLKIAKCAYDEILGTGKTVIELGSENYEVAPSYNDGNTYNIPNNLYYVDTLDDTGATDVSSSLQEMLNTTYGGLFVLKNGTYRLDNPITIPNNTMISSFGNSFSRSKTNESNDELVKFISYSNDACVKLGSYSGINGIRIYNPYKDIDTAKSKLANSQSDSFVAVKGIGDNSFAINTETTYTFTGFDFSSVNNHYVKYCYGSAYETFIKAGNRGKIVASLSNLNFLSRSSLGLFAVSNTSAIQKYIDFETTPETLDEVRNLFRTYSTMISINNSNELVLNCFSYGVKCLINSTSTTLLAVNTSLDYLLTNNYVYVINGGDATIANTFRVFGKSFNLVSGHIKIYGRFDFDNKREKSYDSNVDANDDPEPLPDSLTSVELSRCESTSGVSGATRSSAQKHSGSYSWRASSTVNPAISYSFSSRNISSYMETGYLRFYLYCSNINNKGDTAYVELTSSGTCDQEEINYSITSQIKVTGWNEILIELSNKQKGSDDEFNPANCNYFRFHLLNASCTYYLDDIYFLYDNSETNTITINNCETLSGANGVSLSDFRMHGSYSHRSNDMVNATFAYNFSAINISSYMASGYLSFYFYCPDTSKLGTVLQVELTSSGIWDSQEITYSVKESITRDGWNHVQIPLSAIASWHGSADEFDPTNCNFFRLYSLESSCYFYLDRVQFVK